MSAQFAFRSLVATALFTILIDLLPFPPLTDDYLMATIFGAVLLGIGLALIMRGNATTGGTDMLAQMLHRRFTSISVAFFPPAGFGATLPLPWTTTRLLGTGLTGFTGFFKSCQS